MLRRKWFPLLIVIVIALAGIGVASGVVWSANSGPQPEMVQAYGITWDVVASGGTTMSSDSFTVLSTTGQAVAGMAAGEEHTLFSGYWQKFVSEVLLPIFFG